MDKNLVFAKSAKGREAIATNSRDISIHERRILIMVDGVLSAGQIIQNTPMFPNVEGHIEHLYREGFIVRADGVGAPVIPSSSSASSGSAARSSIPANIRALVEQEVAEFMGPMASIVCEETWEKAASLDDALRILSFEVGAAHGAEFMKNVSRRLG